MSILAKGAITDGQTTSGSLKQGRCIYYVRLVRLTRCPSHCFHAEQIEHPRSQPHVSQDLITLYGLQPLANTVRRKDPKTGEKANKLRKSYEGHLKYSKLPGRNKAVSIEGELLGFTEWSAEAWYDQRVHGRELERAESSEMMTTKLAKALKMNTGSLPREEHEKWKATIGVEDPAKTPLAAATTAKTAAQATFARTGQALTGRASAPASPRGVSGAANAARPSRVGTKRSYQDASFEGYTEAGLAADDGGYSTGGERRGLMKKARVES